MNAKNLRRGLKLVGVNGERCVVKQLLFTIITARLLADSEEKL